MDLKEVIMVTTIIKQYDDMVYNGEWRVVKLDQMKREVELTNGAVTIWKKFDEITPITIKNLEG